MIQVCLELKQNGAVPAPGLTQRQASQQQSNNPRVKGTLPLFFSKLKLPLSVTANGGHPSSNVAGLNSTFTRKSQNVVRSLAGSQYQREKRVTWEQLRWNWILLDSTPWVNIVFISASYSSSGAQSLCVCVCVLQTYKSSERFSNYCRHLFPAARLHL